MEKHIDYVRAEDKRLRQEAKMNGGRYQSNQEIKISRQKVEEKKAKDLRGNVDKRHYSVQMTEAHFNKGVSHELKGLVFSMATLLETKGGGRVTDRNYNDLNIKEIANRIGKSRNTISPLLDQAVEEGMISVRKEGKDKYFTLSKEFYGIGNLGRNIPHFVRLIHTEVLKVCKKLNLEELGLLSDLINFMHPELFILVRNPLEPSEKYLEILRPKDIAIMFNIDTPKVNRTIRKLIALEVFFRMEVGDKETRTITKVIGADSNFFSKKVERVPLDKIKRAISQTALSNKNHIKY